MVILVTKDPRYGLVTLRRSRYVESGEPNRDTFTMTVAEWDDFLYRAASYELEPRKLPKEPVTIPLEEILIIRQLLGVS